MNEFIYNNIKKLIKKNIYEQIFKIYFKISGFFIIDAF